MARLRKQIPIVVEALRKTKERYKRNFDHLAATSMFRVRSAFISRLKGCKSHAMGHAGMPLPSSL